MTKQELPQETKIILGKVANTIRGLAMDAVEKASSGHPGLPMGCAEIGAYLFGHLLRHNPKNPKWQGRDRFILSAGHGSMWLYSCLHLAGFDVTMEDIKNFRQLHGGTPGHPENMETVGVETTTGPLGQGVGNAVGLALGMKLLRDRFHTDDFPLFDNKVFCLASDGDIMEGVASEASSLAGHLKLDNLVVIYDSNRVSLDGPLSDSCSEDTQSRYKAYGWQTYEVDGHDLDAIHRVLSEAMKKQEKPVFVVAHTIIGRGAPHKAGSSKAHGSPLGADEVLAAKKALGIPETPFYVPEEVTAFFVEKRVRDADGERLWQECFAKWQEAHPDKWATMQAMEGKKVPRDIEDRLRKMDIPAPVAGRKASSLVVNAMADWMPQLIGGSADLSSSDLTLLTKYPVVSPGNFAGRSIKFGVREFAMGTMATGLTLTGYFTPFVGTFMVFSDYMRNAIRLASLMRRQVVYQLTHDSIFLGEDGPTHQPVEHLAALRAIPNLQVIRPADAREVAMSWLAALRYRGPTALVLSRQNLPAIPGTDVSLAEGVGRGAYIIKREKEKADYLLVATGSEVSLAVQVGDLLEAKGRDVRIVSMPCWEIFDRQSDEYKVSVFGGPVGKKVAIEAGISQGWHKYIGSDGIMIGLETYGASAPMKALAEAYGFTPDAVLAKLLVGIEPSIPVSKAAPIRHQQDL